MGACGGWVWTEGQDLARVGGGDEAPDVSGPLRWPLPHSHQEETAPLRGSLFSLSLALRIVRWEWPSPPPPSQGPVRRAAALLFGRLDLGELGPLARAPSSLPALQAGAGRRLLGGRSWTKSTWGNDPPGITGNAWRHFWNWGWGATGI